MSTRDETQEVLALRLSLYLVILLAACALPVAAFSDSEAMTLEAMSTIVDVVVAVLAIVVARKVHAPADQHYQFGYAKYEPLMTTVEGILVTGVCTGALIYAVRDILHPDPIANAHLVVVYSAASFALALSFGIWMRGVGRRMGSPLTRAEGDYWIIDGWFALGVCVAFAGGLVLTRMGHATMSAYIDPMVSIVLSLIFLKKPYDILRESIRDLVDANPYADTVNAVEQSAREVAERFGLRGVEAVQVRKAGRRVFTRVSFFEDASKSLQQMEEVSDAVTKEIARLDVDVDVVVTFRPASGPRAARRASGESPGAPTAATP